MENNITYPQELLSSEDWQTLTSFFELLIEADKKEKVMKYGSKQETQSLS
jgi:hypothetical protein